MISITCMNTPEKKFFVEDPKAVIFFLDICVLSRIIKVIIQKVPCNSTDIFTINNRILCPFLGDQ